MDVVVKPPGSSSERSIRYAFGGTPAAPLVERVVRVEVHGDGDDSDDEDDEDDDGDKATGQRMQMHDALLDDIAQVFDGALATLDDTTQTTACRGIALDTLVGAIEYGTAVLGADISVKYVAFFQRTQAVLQRLPVIATAFGRVAVEDVKQRLDGPWQLLLGIAKLYSVPLS
jgi:hypothetical protein